ncbi:hypothetical protein JCM30760_26750 [Thiomicrorhabdus hydrogeniphila]
MKDDKTEYQPIKLIQEFRPPGDYTPEENGWIWESLSENEFYEKHDDHHLVMTEDLSYALSDFIKGGRNIFHLEPELIELFKKTSIEDLVLEDVKLPYNSFYIHFGEEAGLLAPGYFDERNKEFNPECLTTTSVFLIGAYLHLSTDTRGYSSLWIYLVTDIDEDENFSFQMDFPLEVTDGHHVKGKKNKLLQLFKESIYDNPHQNDLMNHKMNKHPVLGNDFDWHKAKEEWKPDALKIAWETTCNKALHIIFNAIIYLTTHDCDIENDYPDSYPQKLVSKTKSTNKKEAKRAESKLESQGFTKINFLGRSFKNIFKKNEGGSNTSVHWRRGHWRNQSYGSKDDLKRRLIWIKPTLVNNNPEQECDLVGHVYNL